jgi:hypothetical protein
MFMHMSLNNLSNPTFAPYFTAMDCVLNGEKAVYCSSELTSGLRAFNEMRKHRMKSSAELKEKLGREWFQTNIFEPNAKSTNEFAASVRRAQTSPTPIITPAPLYIQGWGQPEYNGFWKELIHTRVESVRFNENWQFSNGCTFEFVEAQEARVQTLDVNGKLLNPRVAAQLIGEAIKQFVDLDNSTLQENLRRIVAKGFPPGTTVSQPARAATPNPSTGEEAPS